MDSFSAIRAVVALYVEGMARADGEMLRRAFHPAASSIGHFDGGLEWAGVEEFIALCADVAIGGDAPVPPFEIESVSVAGDTAVVRVVNVWAEYRFRDTLSLLDHDGRWQIVSKVFLHLA